MPWVKQNAKKNTADDSVIELQDLQKVALTTLDDDAAA
jgi:hypothetical protein